MKALTKGEREILRMKCRGRCSYCGEELRKNWHADHMIPVRRVSGIATRPQHDHLANLWPACHRCNIHKHALSLESWRRILEESHDVLMRNYATYKHATRFGLVKRTERHRVIFFFESNRRRII